MVFRVAQETRKTGPKAPYCLIFDCELYASYPEDSFQGYLWDGNNIGDLGLSSESDRKALLLHLINPLGFQFF